MKKIKKLVIIGAGKSLEEIFPILLMRKDEYFITAIYDDDKKYYKKNYHGIPIKIGIDKAKSEKDSFFVFAIGSYINRKTRTEIFKKIEINKDLFPNIIDPTVKIGNNTKFGFGNIIYPYGVLCSDCLIGDFCHLTYSVILGHNVVIGSYSVIGSRSTILNGTVLGNHVFVGANVTIAENLKIGSMSSLLLGSLITNNCEPKKTYFGNPAKIINL